MSEMQFRRMRDDLRKMFPDVTEKDITHACNLIGNEIRKCKADIYEVIIHTHCMASDPGYHQCFDVTFGAQNHQVYGKIIVD